MISQVKNLPELCAVKSAELIRIKCLYDAYAGLARFWEQNGSGTLISMLDGNVTVYNSGADITELREFLSFVSPSSVFSDSKTLEMLGIHSYQKVCVMSRFGDISPIDSPDELRSDEIYEILNTEGLKLPPYEYFAVDFCRRKNLGGLQCFAKKDRYAAISISSGQAALIQGIASRVKGEGSRALCGIVSRSYGKTVLACAREELCGFYTKNGFEYSYSAGYCVRNENGIF